MQTVYCEEKTEALHKLHQEVQINKRGRIEHLECSNSNDVTKEPMDLRSLSLAEEDAGEGELQRGRHHLL